METWSVKTGFKISKSTNFTEQQMKDTVNLQPAPGDCVAVYLLAGKGKTPVACMPTDPMPKDAIKVQETARRASEKEIDPMVKSWITSLYNNRTGRCLA